MTVQLYDYIRSELIKRGFNEFVDKDGNLIFFDTEHQFLTKILSFDEEISTIVDKLFTSEKLEDADYDQHFKRTFLMRFLHRPISRQSIEAFRVQLLYTFLANRRYIESIYQDLDKYIHGTSESKQVNSQKNQQKNDSTALTDNRQAYANLPQDNVQLDVDSTTMDYANDNTISRNKQTNSQNTLTFSDGETTNETKTHQLDQLFRVNGLEEQLFNEFDRKCFKQTW